MIAGLVIAGALAFLLLEGLNNATVYFKTADQAVADKASLGTRPVPHRGHRRAGRPPGRHDHRLLDLRQRRARRRWSTAAEPPQLFKPGVPVVLEGHWQGPVYASDQIMVKHTASYVEAHPDRLKSQLPSPTTLP